MSRPGLRERNLHPVLISLLVAACSPPRIMLDVPVEVRFGGQQLQCAALGDGPVLSDFRAYVYDVRLIDREGEAVPTQFVQDPVWQNRDIALLDLENGQESCANGSTATNDRLRLMIPAGDYIGLRMRLGVPPNLNHADPLLAASPLNQTAMHWHWRSGYKFLRAGVKSTDDGFWMHLGSSRCSGTVGDLQGCEGSNRSDIELPEFRPGEHAIVFDLQTLTATIDLFDSTPTSCSSGPTEEECIGPFAAFGIDFDSGDQAGENSVVRTGIAQ